MTDTTPPASALDSDTVNLPILPLRDIVVFPHMIVPLFVGREKSVKALEHAMNENKQVLLLTQRDAAQETPEPSDLYTTGTVATVLQMLKLPDGTVKVLVEGSRRARVLHFLDNGVFLSVQAAMIRNAPSDVAELNAMERIVVGRFDQYVKMNKKTPPEVLGSVNQIDDPERLADTVASHMVLKIWEKQELLEAASVVERFEKILSFIESEISVLQVEKKIRGSVKRQMEKTQREYYLNEQMKAIQKELGESEDGKNEADELAEKIENARMSKEAKDKALSELKKLRSMSPMSAEATVVRNYLDWMLSLPWKKRSRVNKDIRKAEGVLEKEHYGLEKVKERIIEYLAVQQRTQSLKGPILCLVGPPGVGKTSLGKSIAKATGRNYVRLSLGGVRDESEIRGHRRTYIGSMPGKIIQGLKKAGTSNPLILLDEVDKMGKDWRGDPSSALLEVLDPEQNNSFSDHYMEVDYDLSNVMFVTTANSLDIPEPLLDRMEVIHLAGYTEDEKVEISRRHLVAKQMKNHGLKEGEWSVPDSVLREIVRYYTRESGVRSLERTIATLCRKAVRELGMDDKTAAIKVSRRNSEKYLGVRKYRFGSVEKDDMVGITTGLAWTKVGGELLSIEAVMVPGKGRMTITGKLGDVMTESIQAARSLVQSRAISLGVIPPVFRKNDIHVHVPEGATPKDGPSAGVAMVTSIVSVLTGIPVRKDVAMTGEITLRGRVLPIGGLKEKLLAALRGGLEKVLIPEDNEKDLAEIPDKVKKGLEIVAVADFSQVLEHALVRCPVPVEWEEPDEVQGVGALHRDGEDATPGPIAH